MTHVQEMNRRSQLVGVLTAAVLVVFAVLLFLLFGPSSRGSSDRWASAEMDARYAAQAEVHRIVRTAHAQPNAHANIATQKTEYLGGGRWRVSGTIDLSGPDGQDIGLRYVADCAPVDGKLVATGVRWPDAPASP